MRRNTMCNQRVPTVVTQKDLTLGWEEKVKKCPFPIFRNPRQRKGNLGFQQKRMTLWVQVLLAILVCLPNVAKLAQTLQPSCQPLAKWMRRHTRTMMVSIHIQCPNLRQFGNHQWQRRRWTLKVKKTSNMCSQKVHTVAILKGQIHGWEEKVKRCPSPISKNPKQRKYHPGCHLRVLIQWALVLLHS